MNNVRLWALVLRVKLETPGNFSGSSVLVTTGIYSNGRDGLEVRNEMLMYYPVHCSAYRTRIHY